MDQLRNVGLVAHVDAGKTTTTEQLLYVCGQVRRPGSVDRGTTQTDNLPQERARGITIRAAATALSWRGHDIHLIDTPGHTDFAPEVRRALAVLDGAALIVSAADGVQPHTERLWRHLEALGLPVLLLVNKVDAEAADPDATLRAIRSSLSAAAVALHAPLGERRGFLGLQDLVAGRAIRWSGTDARDMVAADAPVPVDARDALAAAVAGTDEGLTERYLAGQGITPASLREALARAVRGRRLFPVLFASAARGIGMQPLLDAIVDLLPPPRGDRAGPFAGRVFKVDGDAVLGKVAHTRVVRGAVRPRDLVRVGGGGVEEKITLIRALQGAPRANVPVARAGDIVALFGLSSVRNGDALGAAADGAGAELALPGTTVRARVDGDRLSALLRALRELEDEDPDLRVEWSDREHEARLALMGPVHAEFLQSVLDTRYGLSVAFDQPTPALLETIGAPCAGSGVCTGPAGSPRFGAGVDVLLEPRPSGGGVEWVNGVRDLPPRYEAAARAALPDCLQRAGPLKGRRVVDVRVALTGGRWSPIAAESAAGDFRDALAAAVRAALASCARPVLLEPVLGYDLIVPEGCVAPVVHRLAQAGASFEVGSAASGRARIQGEISAVAAWQLPADLAALARGRAIWETRLSRYRELEP